MSDIILHKHNESKVRIECDQGIAAEIRDHLTFMSPNAQYDRRFKARIWDGKIRLYSPVDSLLDYGLVWELVKFAKARKYEITSNLPTPSKILTDEEVAAYMQSLDPHAHGKKITAKDYQVSAIRTALNRRRMIIQSPTASGKSLIIYGMIRHFLDNEEGTLLLIVPRVNLVEQMYSDFADYAGETGWIVGDHCQRVHGDHPSKIVERRVVISTWQSLQRLPEVWFHTFSGVLVDEAHEAEAKVIKKIMTRAVNASFRIGLTGTLRKDPLSAMTVRGLFGPEKKMVETVELMERGDVSRLKIDAITLQYDHSFPLKGKQRTYHNELDLLFMDDRRNAIICNLANRVKGNTIVFFSKIAHGKTMFDTFTAMSDKPAFFIDGSVETVVREQIRAILEEKDNAVLFASYGTMSTGANIRNLHNGIFAAPSKSLVRVLQSLGRGLRNAEGKETFHLYDFGDNYVSNITWKHFQERLSIYRSEKFDYTMRKINL